MFGKLQKSKEQRNLQSWRKPSCSCPSGFLTLIDQGLSSQERRPVRLREDVGLDFQISMTSIQLKNVIEKHSLTDWIGV